MESDVGSLLTELVRFAEAHREHGNEQKSEEEPAVHAARRRFLVVLHLQSASRWLDEQIAKAATAATKGSDVS